jgi:hypothetical protein
VPEDQKPVYKTDDTVFFKDNINDRIDTFSLDVSNSYWGSDHSTYQRYKVMYYLLMGKTRKEYIYTTQSISGIGAFSVYIVYNPYNSTTVTNYTQNGITYPSVFEAHARSVPDTVPNTFYYTYKYGILRYEFNDGRVYELMRK